MTLFPPLDLFVKGTLLLFDKGFVAYDRLRQIQAAALQLLADDLLAEAQQLRPTRSDSFRRLTLLIPGAAAAERIPDGAR
jgi:hypothetical protein